MREPPVLSRRGLLAGASVAAVGAQAAEPAGPQTDRIRLGETEFVVPKAYRFGEIMPPGVSADGLPPYFSFAFTMPDGAPAGEGLEFPPISRPFVLEREGGRFLVMCYRVCTSGPGAIHKPPSFQLSNVLYTTLPSIFAQRDGALLIGVPDNPLYEHRYIKFIDKKNHSGVENILRLGDPLGFYYGVVDYETLGTRTIIYIPASHISEAVSCLETSSQLLFSWKTT